VSRKALLLRVGIDTGYGGTLAPIYEDGAFEFIPIYETADEETSESRTYSDIEARRAETIAEFVPAETATKRVHLDPEFDTYTYGDPTGKRDWVRQLDPNDLLVFYAGLKPSESVDTDASDSPEKGLYIIGHFCVNEVVDFQETSNWEQYRHRYPENAHMKRAEEPEELVLISGDPKQSALLEKGILISKTDTDSLDRRYYVASDELEDNLDVSGKIQQSVPPRWIRGQEQIEYLESMLSRGLEGTKV